jgi:hypothetical protein
MLRVKDGWSLRAIARELHRAPSTVAREIRWQPASLITGLLLHFKLDTNSRHGQTRPSL